MEVSIYRLQDGKYQTSFKDPILNRRIRNKFNFKREAKEHQKSLLVHLRSFNLAAKSTTPLGEFIPMYLEKNPRATMFSRSPYVYKSFIATFGSMAVSEVNKMHLGQWLEKIQKERDYAPRTMVLLKYCFTPFFNYLSDLGVIAQNPMSQVKVNRHSPRRNERIWFSESEVQDILERLRMASPMEIYPVSYFQLHTATYIGEVVKLKWTQIDLERGTVSLPATGSTRDRTLPLSPKLVELLKSLTRRSEFVFVREDGRSWSVVSYYRKFARVRKKIAHKINFDSFAFRHTFAYHFLRKGGSITQLQALLGHRNIDMTVFMYGSITAKNTEKTTPYDF
jgi:integrase